MHLHRRAAGHLTVLPRSPRRPRSTVGAALVAALGAGVLVGGPAPTSLAADSVTPGAPAMPTALPTARTPAFALRSVPAWATPSNIATRVKPSDGGIDKRYQVSTPVGSVLFWGDWNRDGAVTPAVYTSGHWAVYDAMLGKAPSPSRQFDFGAPGDKPVVGDWNADGRTDIGVVRRGTWLLRNAPSAGNTWRKVKYGRTTDVPVTGDWNGDGTAGIGVRRGARYLLRQTPMAGKPTYDYKFGVASDVSVVGDWDGDGTDALGVVRGSRWLLRSKSTVRRTKPTVTRQVVDRPSDPSAQPAPWPTRAGKSAAACPTATGRVAARQQVGPTVVPSAILDKALPYDEADPNLAVNPVYQLRNSLLESERYLLGAQYFDRWYATRTQRFTDILNRMTVQEYAVRRPAMAALTVAVAARTGAHSTTVAARTRDEAIRYVDWLVRSIACEHRAISPGGWGSGWQTAHWAFLTGEAAWLVWDQLAPQTREYVAQMIVYEASRRLMIMPRYWADRSGILPAHKGDTKAEEDAWNAGILELAAVMMPKHAQVSNWRRRAIDLELTAYGRIADLSSPEVVNGVAMSSRLKGVNIYDDGTLENHDVIHPDYMSNIQMNWWAADVAGLAGKSVTQAALHNGPLVYGAVSSVNFAEGAPSPANGRPYATPGGTMYRPGTNDIYYPQGSVWGTVRRAHFVSFDAHALAYGLDSATPWAAKDALTQHLAGQQALVASNGIGDGRTYSYDQAVANTQESYNGREEYAASQLAAGWLSLYVSANAWDRTFNVPPLNTSTYQPLPPLTQKQTGWFGYLDASQHEKGERLSP
jgi:hypothetical protein